MTIVAALLVLCLTVDISSAAGSPCQNPIHCPCGSTRTNVTVCNQPDDVEPCKKLSRCKTCQEGLNKCLQCPEGLEGPFCSRDVSQAKSRRKRQYYTRPSSVRRPQRRRTGPNVCTNLDSPKLGSIRCVSSDRERSCIGRCLPGYSFETYDSTEITLVCRDGTWTPLPTFPACISGGHCDLVVVGAGSFNCTTGMDGTRCDVNCGSRYAGRYFCYPRRDWEPALPSCVVPKEVDEPQSCRCEYGASCDRSGNCVCPVGRTGTYCEDIVVSAVTCSDPGFVTNGYRRNSLNIETNRPETFEEGEFVDYGCNSDDYVLRGPSRITCTSRGTWSNSRPRCIPNPIAAVTCPDPGQVQNADRLNTDGSASMRSQQYRVGQSVVYTCHPGFALQSRSLITCLNTGSWSGASPYCIRLTSPTQSSTTTTTARPGNSLRFCQDPGVDPNGSRRPRSPLSRRGFPQGTRLEYSCNQDYTVIGERSLFCEISGEWSASRPRCDPDFRTPDRDFAYCLNPGTISNGQVVYYPSMGDRSMGEPQPGGLDEPEYPFGSLLRYSCNNGYTLKGRSSLTCEETGFWSSDPPVCRRDTVVLTTCKNLGTISNGQVEYLPNSNERRPDPPDPEEDEEAEYPQGSRLQYSCDREFIMEGDPVVTCQPSGFWSLNRPRCLSLREGDILYCDNPGPIMNGRIEYTFTSATRRSGSISAPEEDMDEYPAGTRLEYFCEDGYDIVGPRTLVCETSGHWSADPPTCDGECGHSFIQIHNKVLNGTKTAVGEWPWVVAISVQDNTNTQLVCGGAILNTRTVITAAHCLRVADRFILRFGKLHLYDKDDDSEVLVRTSTRLISHPDFNNETLDSDIGLILFEPRIRYSTRVQPICLPTAQMTARNLMTGKIGFVAGWGINEDSLQTRELMLAELPVINLEDCEESYRLQNVPVTVTRNMFCAGYQDTRQSACEGDSGSGLYFYDRRSKKYFIEGVVSYGTSTQCEVDNVVRGRYTIFTKVFQFLPWVYRNLQL